MAKLRRDLRPRWGGGRLRFLPPEYFERSAIDVDGRERTYWTAPGTPAIAGAPLLVALHGLNSSGSRLARWSGLDHRAAGAGVAGVFPDALGTIWDDHGCGRRDGADDAGFVARLVSELVGAAGGEPSAVVLTGVSTGATFAERLVRTGAVAARGLALVVGTARVASAATTPIAQPGVEVMLIAGTADPMLPYEGGAARGTLARLTLRQVQESLLDASGHESVAPEALAAEWAAANGCVSLPTVEALAPTAQGFAVARLRWEPSSPDGAGVTLYRIAGGGHGWPDGRQYLPARYLGRIPQGFDATRLVLDLARAAAGPNAAALEPAVPAADAGRLPGAVGAHSA